MTSSFNLYKSRAIPDFCKDGDPAIILLICVYVLASNRMSTAAFGGLVEQLISVGLASSIVGSGAASGGVAGSA